MFKTVERCKEQELFCINEMGYTTLFASEEVGNYIMAKVDKQHGDIQLLEITKNHENPTQIVFSREEFDRIAELLK